MNEPILAALVKFQLLRLDLEAIAAELPLDDERAGTINLLRRELTALKPLIEMIERKGIQEARKVAA